ncbi:MAG TPA: hypothetical protein VKB65_06125, partial [Myxococcota bacterium]|nr:hypothetical protein [Myxococcota bacterium]
RDATPDASLDADTDEGAWLERDTDSDASLDDDPRATGGLGTPIVGDLATLDPYPDEPGAGDDERPWASRLSGASRPDESAAVGPFGAPPPPAPADPLVFDEGGVRDEELDSAFDEAESDRDQMLGADDVAQAALSTVPDEEDGDGELDPLPRVDVADGEDDFAPAAARPAHAFDVDPAVDVRDAGDAEDEDENDDGALADPGSPFATETVAGLLERQGHAADAERLRERIASIPAPGAGTPPASGADATPAPASAPGADATPAPASATADDGSADRAEDAEASEPPPRSGGPAKQATLERWLDNLRRDKR